MSTPAAAYDRPSAPIRDAARGPAERFGGQVVQMLGASEHPSERICRCVSEERSSQRRRWAAWAPKLRLASLAASLKFLLRGPMEDRRHDRISKGARTASCPSRAAAAPP